MEKVELLPSRNLRKKKKTNVAAEVEIQERKERRKM